MVTELRLRKSEDVGRPIVGADRLPTLSEYVSTLSRYRSSTWAWDHYKDVLAELIRVVGARRIMEIGGGREPFFDGAEIAELDVQFIVNDISEKELERARPGVEKVCFDIARRDAADLTSLQGKIDLIFSRMVLEHVADVRAAYTNVHRLLAVGGICINFHPVLWSPPFLINYVLPTAISERLLRRFSPARNPDAEPKFPAKYDHCFVNEAERKKLRSIGFRYVWQIPFWYHGYFKPFPVLYQLDRALNRVAARQRWTTIASYCYTIVLK